MRFLALAAVVLFAGSAQAAIDVYGTNEPIFASVAQKDQLPARTDAMWGFIAQTLKVPVVPGPAVYLYPFDAVSMPQILKDLMDAGFGPIPALKNPDYRKRYFAGLYGITYDEALLPVGHPLRGRVIQINVNQAFVRSQDIGYGLYVTSHEMVHYALNRLGILPKYHHCVMARVNASGDSVMLRVARKEVASGWAQDGITALGNGTPGFGEERGHCTQDGMAIARSEGWDAYQAFLLEVDRISDALLK